VLTLRVLCCAEFAVSQNAHSKPFIRKTYTRTQTTAAAKRKTPARVKTEAGGGSGSGGGSALAAQRIQIERGDLAKMRAKISQYQEAAADAQTKLASLLSATVRAVWGKTPRGRHSVCTRANCTHTQNTQTHPPHTHHQHPPQQEYDELVGAVVRMMLFRQHEKPGVPVKRQELLDACLVRGARGCGGGGEGGAVWRG
jgi:hypothetical protein